MTKIILVRIRGMVNVDFRIETTLDLLRLRKKFSCVLVENIILLIMK
jgi:ribosomal protein L30/L7E